MAYVAGSVAPAMKPNYVLRSWREGGQNVGAWLDSADAFIAENMGALLCCSSSLLKPGCAVLSYPLSEALGQVRSDGTGWS